MKNKPYLNKKAVDHFARGFHQTKLAIHSLSIPHGWNKYVQAVKEIKYTALYNEEYMSYSQIP